MYSNQQLQYSSHQPQQQQYAQQISPPYNSGMPSQIHQQMTGYYPNGQQQQPYLQQQQAAYTPQQNSQSGVHLMAPPSTGLSYQQSPQLQQQPPFQAKSSIQMFSENENLKAGPKIPNVRLSFLTADDQAKFEQLFRAAVGSEVVLSGGTAREILLRSKLPSEILSKIWALSDTTKSGSLYFPEFCLAMSLCNKQLTGRGIPDAIDEKTLNEVSSLVDIISFGIEDSKSKSLPPSNAPNFEPQKSLLSVNPLHQPSQTNVLQQYQFAQQPQFNVSTGFQQQPQQIGVQQSHVPASQPHSSFRQTFGTSLQPNMTGIPQVHPQYSNFSTLSPAPLSAQPTGVPGQWGFVNAPTGGLPGMDALQARLMPQIGREGGYSVNGLQGNATIPWAITKEEKVVYDQIFRAWDGVNKGFIDGSTAIEIFGQSGLPRSDLEKVWTLADPYNRGKLNTDEFAISLHLIYRKLNGYDIPARLPQELVPPSWRNISDSINQVKTMLKSDASRKISPSPQLSSLTYNKESFSSKGSPSGEAYQKGSIYRSDDTECHYKSSARRRVGGGSPSPGLTEPNSQVSRVEDFKNRIREKKILLESIDTQDQENVQREQQLERRDHDEADYLYREIRKIQAELDRFPTVKASLDERISLKKRLQSLDDKLPMLVTNIRKVEEQIANARIELFRVKEAQSSGIVGTGLGGNITEADRRKAKAAAMLQSRMAVLTGQNVPSSTDTGEGFIQRLADETERIKTERERNETVIREIDESADMLRESIKRGLEIENVEREDDDRRRWEGGFGVEDEVKRFILELQRSSKSHEQQPLVSGDLRIGEPGQGSTSQDTLATEKNKEINQSIEDRAAWVKAEAERRMNERLAALGIKPISQRQASPSRADIKLDASEKKKPVPPPPRKSVAPAPPKKRATEGEKVLKTEQDTQESLHSTLGEQSRLEEEEVMVEKARQDERLRRLEEEVQQGRLKKADEAKRAEASRLAKEREEKLQNMRAEIEAKKEEEMKLQQERELLLEITQTESDGTETPVVSVGDGEHSKEEPVIPQAPPLPSTTTNPFLNKTATSATSSGVGSLNELNNPFFKFVGSETGKDRAPITGSGHLRADSGDDWSIVKSDDGHSSTDEDEAGGFSAGRKPTDLAAILFGGMGLPRKVNAPPGSIPPANVDSGRMPPPPPPVAAVPPPPTPDRSALLSAIQAGTGLRKVQTIDKSAPVAGRVL